MIGKIGILFMLALCASAAYAAQWRPCTIEEQANLGATHCARILYSDLTDTNLNTAQTLTNLYRAPANTSVRCVVALLKDEFTFSTGTSTDSLTMIVGDGSDTTRFIESMQITTNSTVWIKQGKSMYGTATTKNAITTATWAVQSADMSFATTNDPVVTPTAQTVDIVYAGTNDPVVTVMMQFAQLFDSTGAAITNADGSTVFAVTNATATATVTPLTTAGLHTNLTATATLTEGTLNVGTNGVLTTQSGAYMTAYTLTEAGLGGYIYTSADTVDFTFTPATAPHSMSQLTAGEVLVYFKITK